MTDDSDKNAGLLQEAGRLAAILGICSPERIGYIAYQLERMPELGLSFRLVDAMPSPSSIITELDAYQSGLRRVLTVIPEPTPFGKGGQKVSPHLLYALGQELAPDEPSDEVMLTAAIEELCELRHRLQRVVRAIERATTDARREQRPATDKDRHKEARGPKYAFEHAVNIFRSVTNRNPWVGTNAIGDTTNDGDVEVVQAFLARMGFRLTPAAIRKRLQNRKLMGTSPKRTRTRSEQSSADQD